MFSDPSLLEDVITLFVQHIKSLNSSANAIVGLESRGFLIGPTVALRLGVPFIPIRKAGKLPGDVRSASYELEYGTDRFEIQTNSVKVGLNCVIVDDLLATGGSMKTAVKLIEECGAKTISGVVIIELVGLGGRQKSGCPIHSLVQFAETD